MRSSFGRLVLGVAVVCAASSAFAADPKFEYGKQEEVKKVEWKASVAAGLILNTGNSNNVSFSASANASRNDGRNKLTLDAGGAYARSTVYAPTDAAKTAGVIASEQDIQSIDQTTTALWNAKLRYDRFFTANNLGYISAFANGNEPAGRRVATGAQIGYARQLLKTMRNMLQLEAGFDYQFENLVADNTPNLNIASLRVYLGYALTFNESVGLAVSAEYLGNLNPYTSPYGPTGPYGQDVSPFLDSRVNGKLALNAKLYKWLSFRFGFTVLFDNVPAPRPNIPGGIKYAPGVVLQSQKVDTITDASLVFTIL